MAGKKLVRFQINRVREKDMFETATKEGIAKGEKMGMEKMQRQGIIKALMRGKLSIAEIAEDFEVSPEYVHDIQQDINKES